MGRHSAAAPAPAPEPSEHRSGSPGPSPAGPLTPGPLAPGTGPQPAAPPGVDPEAEPPASPGGDLRSRAVLALAVGVATLLTTSWAGLPWGQAGIAAGGAALLVLVAGWVAGTMPPRPTPSGTMTPRPTPYSDARDSDHQRE